MRVIRLGRSCLLASASLALGALACASASAAEPRALPEVGRCVKVAVGTGAYKGALCITRETGVAGKYEWMPASVTEDLKFEGGGIEVKLAAAGHPTVECVVANVSGTFTGPKTATAHIELQACTNTLGELCHSATAENQITSLPLDAELGFIKNEVVNGRLHVKVGIDFKPQPPLPALISYQCGSGGLETANVEGSVIAADKPIDKTAAENRLIFRVTQKGTQDPERFQEGVQDTLSTTFTTGLESTTAPSTLSVSSYVGKYSAPLEIKAKEN